MCQRNDFGNKPPLEGSPSQSLQWCLEDPSAVSGPDCTLLGSLSAVFPQGSRPLWYAAVSRSTSAWVPVATR
jgi:hypothetical protein